MGRTIHFTVTNEKSLSEKELEEISKISEEFNPEEGGVWTCENFYLDPFSFQPNWKDAVLELMLIEAPSVPEGREKVWKFLEETLDNATKREGGKAKAIKRMEEDGLIYPEHFSGQECGNLHGFVKVGGDELNAALVLLALITITKRTSAEISVSDEGDFLYASLELKNGKARIDKEEWLEAKKFWERSGFIREDKFGINHKIAFVETHLLKYFPDWTALVNLCRISEKDLRPFFAHTPHAVPMDSIEMYPLNAKEMLAFIYEGLS